MTKIEQEKVEWFEDACGYLMFCLENSISHEEQLFNLQHDIIGLQKQESCFLPRLNGYRKCWIR